MKYPSLVAIAAAFASVCAFAAPPTVMTIHKDSTTTPVAAPTGGATWNMLELDPATSGGDTDNGDGGGLGDLQPIINRSIKRGALGINRMGNSGRTKSNPSLSLSFEGLNLYDQRYANGGNQFTVEPPDQGLCAGNGYVMESVNDVLSIYDQSGNQVVGPVDLNTFYGYGDAINRTTGAYGAFVTDPSCYYDTGTKRWFQVVLTLDRYGTTSYLDGNNHLDIAVSKTSDPTGEWTIYRLPVQNNGTQGTPDHHCGGYCLGDYPHIGADKNAIFLTTNEFSLVYGFFRGAQIYALSKQALVAGASDVNVALFDSDAPGLNARSFTVIPAISTGTDYAGANGGTEYLLSSDAVFHYSGQSSTIWLWAVGNTKSIDSDPINLTLNAYAMPVQEYGVPSSLAQQKPGNTPFLDCLKLSGCGTAIFGYPTVSDPGPRPMAVNDSRMEQVTYANGKVWGTLDTDVLLQDGSHGSGINYFVFNPQSRQVVTNGTLALPDANLTYGALGVTSNGRGVIAFTLVGPNDYPSAGYASLDALAGAGDVHVAAAGAGPWDGFTGISLFGNRPRWGDYGAAAVDGNTVWTASEYIGQSCTLEEYLQAPIFTCGNTRGALSNWSTRVSAFKL